MTPEDRAPSPDQETRLSQPTRTSQRGEDTDPGGTVPHGQPVHQPAFDPQAPQVGQWLVDRYQLRVRLGQGGMGMVWRALDEELERDVAIKFLPPEITADARAQRQLKVEAQAAIALAHPNIVKVLSFRRAGQAQFLEMEYVEGPSLSDVLQERGALSEADVQAYLLDVCAGLAEAHRQGVVHRDIKPANLLLAPDGSIKIADFGIARIVAESTTRTTGQATAGTLLYMAPEQLRGRPCDARSDLYSLGITAYELVSGDVPYPGGDITYQHLHERPESLETIAPTLWPVIAKMLEKVPEDRYQDAWDLAKALGGDAGPRRAPSSATQTPVSEQATRVMQRAATPAISSGPTVMTQPRPAAATAPPTGRGPLRWILAALTGTAVLAVAAVFFVPRLMGPDLETVRTEAVTAQRLAKGIGADTLVEDVWHQAEKKLSMANDLRDQEDDKAFEYYDQARALFEEAAGVAVNLQEEQEAADAARTAMGESRTAAANAQATDIVTLAWNTAEALKSEGEAAYEAGEFDSARSNFANAASAYASALSKAALVTEREAGAEHAKQAAATARTSAATAGAERYGTERWTAAEQLHQAADAAFSMGEFDAAEATYGIAAKEFAAAEAAATAGKRDEQTWLSKVQTAQTTLATAKQQAQGANAMAYAGGTWNTAERLLAEAAAQREAGAYADAVRLYGEATAAYDTARTEAAANKSADTRKTVTAAAANAKAAAAEAAESKRRAAALDGEQIAPVDWAAATTAEALAGQLAATAQRTHDLQTYAEATNAYGQVTAKYAAVVRKAEGIQDSYNRAVTSARTALRDEQPAQALGHLAAALKTGVETPELRQLHQQAQTMHEAHRVYQEAMADARGLAPSDPRKALDALARAEEARPNTADARTLRGELQQRQATYEKQIETAQTALAEEDWKATLAALDAATRAWPPETDEARGLRETANKLQFKASDSPRRKSKSKFDYMGDR